MIRLKLLVLGILVASITIAKPVSLNMSFGVFNSPYKNYDHNIYSIPTFNYEGDSFWFHGLGGGYYFWKDSIDKISIITYYDQTCFNPNKSYDYQLRLLYQRYSSLLAGLYYIHNTEYGSLNTILAADILNNSNGFIWDLSWEYYYTHGMLTLTSSVGMIYNSKNYNNYYYSISRQESAISGMKYYNAIEDFNSYFKLTAHYIITDNWSIYMTGRCEHLQNEIKNSPMIDKSWTSLFLTGISYKF